MYHPASIWHSLWRKAMCAVLLACLTISAVGEEHVVLLHGLLRSPRSMKKIEKCLKREGYVVWNIGYPSREYNIEGLSKLVADDVWPRVHQAKKVHFVTHSLGGILVRKLHADQPLHNLGRVVMMSPPNQGSKMVDLLGESRLMRQIFGPAFPELRTDPSSVPSQLGPVDFELGVLCGDRTIYPFVSMIVPGEDDGIISVETSRIEGMTDHKVMHTSHSFITRNREAIRNTIHFLKQGHF